MLTRVNCLAGSIAFCALVWLGTDAARAQNSVAELQKRLREQTTFAETDFAALQQGQTVVRLLPVNDKREVAVFGLVSLQVPSEVFLQTYRESMTRKSSPAILEIGSFSPMPTREDLQSLTFEDRDIDDLKECVVGDCKLKLSASMIDRFHREMDWEAPDYRIRASELLKRILLDYVRDYLARGDMALIEYNDKANEVRLVEDQRALMAASGYLNNILPEFPQHLKEFTNPGISVVEDAIVWSKFKFGLKPVIAINHIMVFKREQVSGPQILVASKQIYANHYFDSSLALTAFVNVTGASPGSYLIYENRSRTDGLQGAFSNIKRGIVEGRAVASLKTILEKSKANLNARALGETEPSSLADEAGSWRRWRVGRVHVFWWLFLITVFVALFTLSNYNWKGAISGRAQH